MHNSTPTVTNASDCTYEPFLDEVSPFLFPFVLEYSLVGAAAMMAMYESVDLYLTKSIMEVLKNALRGFYNQRRVHSPSSVHKDQHGEQDFDKSHVGMFVGFLFMAGVLISTVIFYFWRSNGHEDDANLCVILTDLIVNLAMLV